MYGSGPCLSVGEETRETVTKRIAENGAGALTLGTPGDPEGFVRRNKRTFVIRLVVGVAAATTVALVLLLTGQVLHRHGSRHGPRHLRLRLPRRGFSRRRRLGCLHRARGPRRGGLHLPPGPSQVPKPAGVVRGLAPSCRCKRSPDLAMCRVHFLTSYIYSRLRGSISKHVMHVGSVE